jgi:hypothetical protein
MLVSFLLSLSGHSSPAQAPGPLALQSTPGEVREVIVPAATVVETAHYQATLTLNCAAVAQCIGDFPKPGRRRRLNITRMSCYVAGDVTLVQGLVQLFDADGPLGVVQFLPADHSGFGGITINSAVDMQITAQQYIYVSLSLAGSADFALCTATGTLDVLQ